MQRRFWWWPAALIVGAAAIWSLVDPMSFREWEGLVLLALFPVGIWVIWRGISKQNSNR